jgi:hypothetical protein
MGADERGWEKKMRTEEIKKNKDEETRNGTRTCPQTTQKDAESEK